MSSLLERIALEVKEKRQGLGMSQEELAAKIDKTTSFIGQLERGESSLKLETFQTLVKCLGMDANALLAGENLSHTALNELCSLAAQMSNKEITLESPNYCTKAIYKKLWVILCVSQSVMMTPTI